MGLRANLLGTDPKGTQGLVPKVCVASGAQVPAQTPQGRVLHLHYAQFLQANGTLRAANEIWNALDKAGLPRCAGIVVFADTLGEAAVNCLIFRMMGFADVKVWAPKRPSGVAP